MDLTHELTEQLTWHWGNHVRPRLEGLTDDEYFWEPVAGCWSIRRRDEARTSMAAGGGEWVADFEYPEPEPAPVTTIAWRLAHVRVGIFGARCASHFGGPPIDYATADWASDARIALAQLDEEYDRWVAAVSQLDEAALARPVGDKEPYPDLPFAALVLHINREAIHHASEVLLLRDLYRWRS
jgi:hypothetical protein